MRDVRHDPLDESHRRRFEQTAVPVVGNAKAVANHAWNAVINVHSRQINDISILVDAQKDRFDEQQWYHDNQRADGSDHVLAVEIDTSEPVVFASVCLANDGWQRSQREQDRGANDRQRKGAQGIASEIVLASILGSVSESAADSSVEDAEEREEDRTKDREQGQTGQLLHVTKHGRVLCKFLWFLKVIV